MFRLDPLAPIHNTIGTPAQSRFSRNTSSTNGHRIATRRSQADALTRIFAAARQDPGGRRSRTAGPELEPTLSTQPRTKNQIGITVSHTTAAPLLSALPITEIDQ